jgi:hypothetical protein
MRKILILLILVLTFEIPPAANGQQYTSADREKTMFKVEQKEPGMQMKTEARERIMQAVKEAAQQPSLRAPEDAVNWIEYVPPSIQATEYKLHRAPADYYLGEEPASYYRIFGLSRLISATG